MGIFSPAAMTYYWCLVICCFLFNAACGEQDAMDNIPGTIEGQDSGFIASPNFPNDYPNSVKKTYRIESKSGRSIVIKFITFDLEYDHICSYDWVMIKDGRTGSVILPKICGFGHDSLIRTYTDNVEITFHSDYIVKKKGFRLVWISTSPTTTTPTTTSSTT